MEAINETQRVINSLVEIFRNQVNEADFLKDMEGEKFKEYFINTFESSLERVAIQKAIDIKNSISTINI